MNLADMLIARASDGGYKSDDLGLQYKCSDDDLKENIDYLCARALIINERDIANGRLYLRDGRIYRGHNVVNESSRSVYELTLAPFSIKRYQELRFWARMKEILPEFSDDMVVITPNYAYDKKNGEIKYSDKPYMAVK